MGTPISPSNLIQLGGGDTGWITDYNDNMQRLNDTLLKLANLLDVSTSPALSDKALLIFKGADSKFYAFLFNSTHFNVDHGTNAIELIDSSIGPDKLDLQGGSTGSRPGSPKNYQQYFDTDLGYPIWWDGSNWVDGQGNTV